MGFNGDLVDKPAIMLDIAQVYVDMRRLSAHLIIILGAVAQKTGIELEDELAFLETAQASMDQHFVELTGWQDDER